MRLSHSGWQVTLAHMSTPTRVLLVLTALVVVAQGGQAAGMSRVIIIVPIISLAVLPAILLPVGRELRRQQATIARSFPKPDGAARR